MLQDNISITASPQPTSARRMMRLRLGVNFPDLSVLDGGLLLSFFLLLAAADSASAADRTISADVGDNVTLPCKAEGNQPLEVVEWSRPGTDTEFVLLLRSPNPDLEVPEKSYEGRVELKDSGKGDMSLVLKNVSAEDGGTYQCYVLGEGSRKKRAELQSISTVYLDVAPPPPPGRGHLGAIVVVVLVLLAGAVLTLAAGAAGCVWNKKKTCHPPSSLNEGVETAEVRLNVEDDCYVSGRIFN